MNHSLLNQLKKRRLELGFKQNDMMLRMGMSRQQYQHLESKGNPRLDTLELIAKGLNSELMLIPKEKFSAIQAILQNNDSELSLEQSKNNNLPDNPWENLLGDKK